MKFNMLNDVKSVIHNDEVYISANDILKCIEKKQKFLHTKELCLLINNIKRIILDTFIQRSTINEMINHFNKEKNNATS